MTLPLNGLPFKRAPFSGRQKCAAAWLCAEAARRTRRSVWKARRGSPAGRWHLSLESRTPTPTSPVSPALYCAGLLTIFSLNLSPEARAAGAGENTRPTFRGRGSNMRAAVRPHPPLRGHGPSDPKQKPTAYQLILHFVLHRVDILSFSFLRVPVTFPWLLQVEEEDTFFYKSVDP